MTKGHQEPATPSQGVDVRADTADALRVRRAYDAAVLELAGEADLSSRDQLARALDDAVAGGADVYVHAGELRFVDVAGAEALVRAAHRMQNGRMIVVSPCRALRVILSTLDLGLPDNLVFVGTREEMNQQRSWEVDP